MLGGGLQCLDRRPRIDAPLDRDRAGQGAISNAVNLPAAIRGLLRSQDFGVCREHGQPLGADTGVQKRSEAIAPAGSVLEPISLSECGHARGDGRHDLAHIA